MSKTDTTHSSQEAVNALDLSVLTQLYSKCLVDALESINGLKTLVIDPSLAGVLGLVIEVSALKAHGIDRMFYLEPGPLNNAQRNIVYLSTANPALMHIVADQVKQSDPNKSTHTLLMVPRISALCTSILQETGVYGQIDIEAFPMELIPLEKDVLSMEVPDSYRSIFLDGDFSCVHDLAKALMTLQRAFGSISRIAGKGDAAHRLVSLMQRLRKEQPDDVLPGKGPIDSLIVIDRQVDLATPLCTQLTYEGLIDELVGIRNSHVEVDPDLVNPPPNNMPSPSTALTNFAAPAKKKKIHLQSTDALYAELRDKNFAVVGPILNKVARRINADYESRHAAMAGSVTQMRSFVGKLGGLQAESQALRLHTGLTEQIMQTTMTDEFNKALEIQQNVVAGLDLASQEQGIRDLINQEAPFKTVLRLVCLLSIVQGGYKPKVFEDLERELLQTYGYEHLPTLLSLNALGLLTRASSSTKSPFAIARKALRLIVDDVDESSPDDIAYVYSGYAPLSARLVQGALGRNGSFLGWKSIEDVVKSLPGKTVEVAQKVSEGASPPAALTSSGSDAGPVTLVCLLGGCTYTEISALRWISQQGRGGRKIVVVTTGIITGGTLLGSLVPKGLPF